MTEEGTQFGPWIVMGTLGRGGFGTGYLVRHAESASLGVLKAMHDELASRLELVARFRREATLMRVMSPGPSRPRMLDAHLSEVPRYVVSEWVPSVSMGDRVATRVPPDLALWWAADIAGALAEAHDNMGTDGIRRVILHRDVSLNNVLLGFDGRAYLIDFGIATARSETRLTAAGIFLGTPHSSAPEAFFGAAMATQETDVFGVGLMLYDALTGMARASKFPKRPAGEQPSLMEWGMLQSNIERNYGTLASQRPDLPASVVALVSRAIAPKFENRYRRMPELRDALLGVLRELGQPAEAPREEMARDLQRLFPDRARAAQQAVAQAASARARVARKIEETVVRREEAVARPIAAGPPLDPAPSSPKPARVDSTLVVRRPSAKAAPTPAPTPAPAPDPALFPPIDASSATRSEIGRLEPPSELSVVRPQPLDAEDEPRELDFRVPVEEMPAPPVFQLYVGQGAASGVGGAFGETADEASVLPRKRGWGVGVAAAAAGLFAIGGAVWVLRAPDSGGEVATAARDAGGGASPVGAIAGGADARANAASPAPSVVATANPSVNPSVNPSPTALASATPRTTATPRASASAVTPSPTPSPAAPQTAAAALRARLARGEPFGLILADTKRLATARGLGEVVATKLDRAEMTEDRALLEQILRSLE